MNLRLNRLDARQRLRIVDAKYNKNVIVFWLFFVSMWSDKEAGWPMYPGTYMVTHITRAQQVAAAGIGSARIREYHVIPTMSTTLSTALQVIKRENTELGKKTEIERASLPSSPFCS